MGGTYSSLYVEGGSEGAREGGPGCRAHTRAVATLDMGTGRLRHRHPGRAPRCQRRGAPVAPWDERARRDLHPATGLDPRAGVFPRLGAQTGAGSHTHAVEPRERRRSQATVLPAGPGLAPGLQRAAPDPSTALQALPRLCSPGRGAWGLAPRDGLGPASQCFHAMCAHTQKRVRTLTPWNLERGAGARRPCLPAGPGLASLAITQGSRARPVHSATSAPQAAVRSPGSPQLVQPGARRVGTCTPRRAWTREPVFSHAMCAHTQKRVSHTHAVEPRERRRSQATVRPAGPGLAPRKQGSRPHATREPRPTRPQRYKRTPDRGENNSPGDGLAGTCTPRRASTREPVRGEVLNSLRAVQHGAVAGAVHSPGTCTLAPTRPTTVPHDRRPPLPSSLRF